MRIAIRADVSARIGSGHLMRCLTLAERLRRDGAQILFVCRNHDDTLIGAVKQHGFALKLLPRPADDETLTGYALWLGMPVDVDAEQTKSAILAHGWEYLDWLLIDHYALDAVWQSKLRSLAIRILVIDDLANRAHDCDILLDQNLVQDLEHRYDGLISPNAVRLLGPRYALLQPEYAELRSFRTERRNKGRVLIFLGSSDAGLTLKALQGFLALERTDLSCDVIVSTSNINYSEIERHAFNHRNVRVFGFLPSLAPLLLEADLVIGAGGATSWERLCLGVRSIVVILAENQRSIAEELDRQGFARLIGNGAEVCIEHFRSALASEIDRYENLTSMQDLVDGLGTDRTVAAMNDISDARVCIRLATESDESLLLDWANDPITRANAFNASTIQPDVHHRWFIARLAEPYRCKIYIGQTENGSSIGQVRLELDQDGWIIDYAIAPAFRGRRLAARLLGEAELEFAKHFPGALLIGKVLAHNIASRRVFRGLGYEEELGDDDATRYTKRL